MLAPKRRNDNTVYLGLSSVNITELIDRCPLGPLQIRIIVLCGLVALLDGFDLLASAWLRRRWRDRCTLRRTSSAPFSVPLRSAHAGCIWLGPIADRYGRRRVLIGATAMFGVFTLRTASAATLRQILLFRFLAGIGLGGAMPSFISLAAEYTPHSNRQAVIGLLWPMSGPILLLLTWLRYIGGYVRRSCSTEGICSTRIR